MRKRMLQLKALPAVGISVLPKPVLRSSASAGDPTRVVSSSSRAGAAPSSLRPRRSSRSPPPPSAPVLGLLLRPTDCAKQPLDSLLHLFPNHIADHRDQTLPPRHPTSFLPPSAQRLLTLLVSTASVRVVVASLPEARAHTVRRRCGCRIADPPLSLFSTPRPGPGGLAGRCHLRH